MGPSPMLPPSHLGASEGQDCVWVKVALANAMACKLIVDNAHKHGILELGIKLGMLPKKFEGGWTSMLPLVVTRASPESLDVGGGNRQFFPPIAMASPFLFYLPKWKFDEFFPLMKWHNVISFKKHFLRRLAKLVGRALSLLQKELSIVYPFFNFPNMLGTRDLFFTACPAN